MIGVSSCLLGNHCTYNASHHLVKELSELYHQGKIVAVCPGVFGGLSIPRSPAEIISVNPLIIKNMENQDVTDAYINGAKKALQLFLKNNVHVAVLKYRSPSCGCEGVYDGTFSHTLIEGQGVFAKMCEENHIKVFHENQLDEFLEYIRKEL